MITPKQAQSKVQHAVDKGLLIRSASCEMCGEIAITKISNRINPFTDEPMPDRDLTEAAIVGHHENYEEPLKVIWLCRKCHYKIHKNKEMR